MDQDQALFRAPPDPASGVLREVLNFAVVETTTGPSGLKGLTYSTPSGKLLRLADYEAEALADACTRVQQREREQQANLERADRRIEELNERIRRMLPPNPTGFMSFDPYNRAGAKENAEHMREHQGQPTGYGPDEDVIAEVLGLRRFAGSYAPDQDGVIHFVDVAHDRPFQLLESYIPVLADACRRVQAMPAEPPRTTSHDIACDAHASDVSDVRDARDARDAPAGDVRGIDAIMDMGEAEVLEKAIGAEHLGMAGELNQMHRIRWHGIEIRLQEGTPIGVLLHACRKKLMAEHDRDEAERKLFELSRQMGAMVGEHHKQVEELSRDLGTMTRKAVAKPIPTSDTMDGISEAEVIQHVTGLDVHDRGTGELSLVVDTFEGKQHWRIGPEPIKDALVQACRRAFELEHEVATLRSQLHKQTAEVERLTAELGKAGQELKAAERMIEEVQNEAEGFRVAALAEARAAGDRGRISSLYEQEQQRQGFSLSSADPCREQADPKEDDGSPAVPPYTKALHRSMDATRERAKIVREIEERWPLAELVPPFTEEAYEMHARMRASRERWIEERVAEKMRTRTLAIIDWRRRTIEVKEQDSSEGEFTFSGQHVTQQFPPSYRGMDVAEEENEMPKWDPDAPAPFGSAMGRIEMERQVRGERVTNRDVVEGATNRDRDAADDGPALNSMAHPGTPEPEDDEDEKLPPHLERVEVARMELTPKRVDEIDWNKNEPDVMLDDGLRPDDGTEQYFGLAPLVEEGKRRYLSGNPEHQRMEREETKAAEARAAAELPPKVLATFARNVDARLSHLVEILNESECIDWKKLGPLARQEVAAVLEEEGTRDSYLDLLMRFPVK